MELIERHCGGCNTTKPINEFSKDKYRTGGFSYRCKICRAAQTKRWTVANPEKVKISNDNNKPKRKVYYSSPEGVESSRRAHLKRMYNLTLEEYQQKLEQQEGKCKICGRTEMNYKNKVLCVDHNHETNEIRGLLCGLCNSGIGKFLDDKQLLMNAIKYLEKYESTIIG